MARFLFATWEGGGHVQPMLLAARGLMEQGHAALALSDACNAPDAAALDVPFRAWTQAPSRRDRSPDSDPLKDWLAKSPMDVIHGLVDGVMCAPSARYAADVTAALADFDADVVVSQELLFGVMAAAEAAGKRLALFAANVWPLPTLAEAPPFGAGVQPAQTPEMREFFGRLAAATRGPFQAGLPALNTTRAALGLGAVADVFEQLDAAGRILLATSRAFDFDQRPPEPYRYVGPYLADPAWTGGWTSPWADDDPRPLVLVSFSTMYQAQEAVLHRVIEALGTLPVRGLVTLGPVLSPAEFASPDNVVVVAKAPHSQILPQAAAMITHAGHASTLRPLIAGVPLVCLPLGRDQPDNAERVAARGAGIRLQPDRDAREIARAVTAVLTEPSYREAARALGARIAADCEHRSAERELAAFAQSQTATPEPAR